ncbi:MAG TPA: Rid family hydrolase [Ilumatobacteraceae bacterium]
MPIVVEGVPPVVVATGRRTFYFTGQIATDSNGELVGGTIEEQALQVFRNLEAIATDTWRGERDRLTAPDLMRSRGHAAA